MKGRFVLERGDDGWPPLLLKESGVDKLYGVGNPAVLLKPCISIVGARRGSPYGKAVAKLVARIATDMGITVVSGGALGVDAAASRAALDAKGNTVLVAGGGANVVYPPSSKDIFEAAWSGRGCVLSLCDFDFKPARWTFPKRNKVIAALSRVLVVTEASIPSGTFSTADMALELGRSIFAAPGSIFSPYSKGTNKLIEEGAQVLVDASGIECALYQEYGQSVQHLVNIKLPNNGRILKALIADPLRPDDLARLLDLNVIQLMQELSQYEVDGLVERLQDGRYSPTEKAFLLII